MEKMCYSQGIRSEKYCHFSVIYRGRITYFRSNTQLFGVIYNLMHLYRFDTIAAAENGIEQA